jgi:hypothetical protein
MPTLDRLERVRDVARRTGVPARTLVRRLEAQGVDLWRDPRDHRQLLADRDALNRLVELVPVDRTRQGAEQIAG